MRKVSKKQAAKNREIAKLKKALSPFCFICGRPASDYAHVLPKSIFPEYYTHPLNGFPACRECHNDFDSDRRFRQQQKALFERALQIDERGAHRYFDI